MKEVFEIIYKYRSEFYIGLTVTLKMTLIIWGIGITLGSLIGVLSAKFKKLIGFPTKLITFFLGGIPVLVFLYWLHYPFQTILGIQIEGVLHNNFSTHICQYFPSCRSS
jgi:ABC-type amino acid transport system permease subunit